MAPTMAPRRSRAHDMLGQIDAGEDTADSYRRVQASYGASQGASQGAGAQGYQGAGYATQGAGAGASYGFREQQARSETPLLHDIFDYIVQSNAASCSAPQASYADPQATYGAPQASYGASQGAGQGASYRGSYGAGQGASHAAAGGGWS